MAIILRVETNKRPSTQELLDLNEIQQKTAELGINKRQDATLTKEVLLWQTVTAQARKMRTSVNDLRP